MSPQTCTSLLTNPLFTALLPTPPVAIWGSQFGILVALVVAGARAAQQLSASVSTLRRHAADLMHGRLEGHLLRVLGSVVAPAPCQAGDGAVRGREHSGSYQQPSDSKSLRCNPTWPVLGWLRPNSTGFTNFGCDAVEMAQIGNCEHMRNMPEQKGFGGGDQDRSGATSPVVGLRRSVGSFARKRYA